MAEIAAGGLEFFGIAIIIGFTVVFSILAVINSVAGHGNISMSIVSGWRGVFCSASRRLLLQTLLTRQPSI